MEALLEEAPALLISVVLVIATTVLVAIGAVPVANPLVTAVFIGVMSFWIGSGTARQTARQINTTLQQQSTPPTPQEVHTS